MGVFTASEGHVMTVRRWHIALVWLCADPTVQEWLTGEQLEPEVAEGVTTVTLTVPAGDVRMLHFTTARWEALAMRSCAVC